MMKPKRTPPRAKPNLANFGKQPDIGSDRVNDQTSVGVNNADMYLEKIHSKAKHEMGEEKGKEMDGNYGSRSDRDNMIYSDRGQKDPDDARLNKQNLPNNRMYSYVQ